MIDAICRKCVLGMQYAICTALIGNAIIVDHCDARSASLSSSHCVAEGIFDAIKSNDIARIRELVGSGIDLDAVNSNSETPLMLSLMLDRVEIIAILLDHGADVLHGTESGDVAWVLAADYCSDYTTALRIARLAGEHEAKNQYSDDSKLTLDQLININQQITATAMNLRAVMRNPNPVFIRGLVADIDEKDRADRTSELLWWAANTNNSVEAVRVLIDSGADVNYSKDGRPIVQQAINGNSNADVLDLLLNKGVDPDLRVGGGGYSLLMVASCFGSTPAAINVLAKHDADFHARSETGQTAITMYARYGKQPEIAKLLVQNGADIESRDPNGFTPLMIASANNSAGIVRALLSQGANCNARSEHGITALLSCAMFSKDPDLLDALLSAGCDAKSRDMDGKIALDYAKENSDLKGTDAYWALVNKSY